MHVQPEAQKVRIGNRPLWAPGAPALIEQFIAERGGEVRVLEYGSGASTIFLLRRGATVTTVEHHDGWAEALGEAATARKIAAKLTILRRDRPYADVPDEFAAGTEFDILLVDGRERIDCLLEALPFVAADGLVLLDDSQRARYWPAFAALAARECVTFESAARNTSIWYPGDASVTGFVRKRFVPAEPPADPSRQSLFVPAEFLAEPGLEPGYVREEPIRGLAPVERDLQSIGLIERRAAYLPPSLFELEDASLRIENGRKLVRHGEGVYHVRSGAFVKSADTPLFEGAVELPGRTLDLTASGAGRYSFFLLDSLPKLALLGAAGSSLDDFETILVNSGAHWVADILSLVLGEEVRKLVSFAPPRPSFLMRRSVHLEGIRSARFTPRWVHAYLEHTFGADPGSGSEEASLGPYVYISRQRASGRQIVNHDEFMELIGGFGFREVFAEDVSPVVLARQLRDARVLISPHGAGLANLILTPRSAKVVELFSSHFTPQYFHLARDREQEYSAFPCLDAEGKNVFDRYTAETRSKAQFNRADIVVPIEPLRRVLAKLCAG